MPAPWRGMRTPRPFLPAFFSAAISRLSLAIFDLSEAWRWSVPLCLGISWSITWRHCSSSSGVVGPAILLLGLEVLRGEIGWHGGLDSVIHKPEIG